jgi:hypothetical protein
MISRTITAFRDDASERPYQEVEGNEVVQQALAGLSDPRLRHIIARRVFDEISQVKVAEELGISQMHVSRLERAAKAQLKVILSGLGFGVLILAVLAAIHWPSSSHASIAMTSDFPFALGMLATAPIKTSSGRKIRKILAAA